MDNLLIIEAIRSIVNGHHPNVDISDILLDHNCFFLLSRLKSESKNADLVKMITSSNLLTIRDRFKACQAVLDELKHTQYAVIKGAVLSKSAYGNVCYRSSSDIDLLTSRENVDEIKRILLQNGFIQGRIVDSEIVPFSRQEILYHTALSHQTAPFLKKTDSRFCPIVNIDVNMDILWGESQKQVDMDKFLLNTQEIEICGVTVKKLTPIAEFISLCLHHYKDINSIYLLSQGSLKLNLFCDVYFYLVNNALDIAELKSMCQELDVSEYVWYCINAANEIFDDEKLSPYLKELNNDKVQELQNSFGLDDTERKEWNIDIVHRLFDDDFHKNFQSSLAKADFEKIQTNEKYML